LSLVTKNHDIIIAEICKNSKRKIRINFGIPQLPFYWLFVFLPLHIAIVGREGDVWETVVDEEGKEEMKKTGVKMKTETELGYEPSLLVNMQLNGTDHLAFVAKDRFGVLTGLTSENNPDVEFFRPHIDLLDLKGNAPKKNIGKPVFEKGEGANWETLKAQREAMLESIKDELLLAYPGRSDEDKVQKVKLIRKVFGEQSSWTALESDTKTFTAEVLVKGRETLKVIIAESKKQDKPEQRGRKNES